MRFLRRVLLWWHRWQYVRRARDMDCGIALAEYIRPDLYRRRLRIEELLAALAKAEKN